MSEIIRLGDIAITVTRKAVKHAHLSVHPPLGRVSLVTPTNTRPEVARAFAISKLGWIRKRRERMREQAREPKSAFVTRESHFVWGKRYLLVVIEAECKPLVRLNHRQILLSVRPGGSAAKRAAVIHDWHKALLHAAIPPLVRKWQSKLGVEVSAYFLQRMKTKWGGCNPRMRTIRLNTELAKKPKDLLEYVVVHEMLHLIERSHGPRFIALLDRHIPAWREARQELNELPLAAERWKA